MIRMAAAIALILSLSRTTFAADCSKPSVVETKSGTAAVSIVVDYCADAKSATATDTTPIELTAVRVDERDVVAIVVRHFNYINYTPSFAIEKTVIESYVTLNQLWSQIIGFGVPLKPIAGPPGTHAPACDGNSTFRECVVAWMWSLTVDRLNLSGRTTAYDGQIGIAETARADIRGAIDKTRTEKAQLVQLQLDVLSHAPESMQDIQWFQQVQDVHDKFIVQEDAYLALATKTIADQTTPVGKQDAGTMVTVRVAARDTLGNDAGGKVAFQYFVNSKLPVVFHAGYTYSGIKQVDVQQVRTLSGADLFQEVQTTTGLSSATAFLSYELAGWHTGTKRGGIYATLGTDFAKPGDHLYVGGSWRFLERIYLTGGVSSASVSQGQNPVAEQLVNQLGVRQLFDAVTTHREWKPFFGISFGVF